MGNFYAIIGFQEFFKRSKGHGTFAWYRNEYLFDLCTIEII